MDANSPSATVAAAVTGPPVPRKRSGRPPKLSSTRSDAAALSSSSPVDLAASPSLNANENSSSSSDPIGDIDGSALAISPTPDEHTNASSPGAGPLLAVAASTASGSGECRRSSRKKIIKFDVRDLLNKNRKPHKIQIEARIDSNAPTSPKPATISHTEASGGHEGSGASTDLTSKQRTFMEKSALFRRLSISEQQQQQKQGSALLMPGMEAAKAAQARRLSRAQEIFNASLQKSKQNSSLIVAQMESSSSSAISFAPTAATVGRPKKNTIAARRKNVNKPAKNVEMEGVVPPQKRRGRPPKNKTLPAPVEKQVQLQKVGTKEEKKEQQQLNTNVEKEEPSTSAAVSSQRPAAVASSLPDEDVILEISSSSSADESELEFQAKVETKTAARRVDVNESQQRNFAAVWFLHETANVNDNVKTPEFIVAAVEEITAETQPSVSSHNELMSDNVIEIDETEAFVPVEREMQVAEVSSEPDNKKLPISRTSSSSESDGTSTVSTGSSERSGKPYKKGDKLRVSLKRMAMPQSPPTEGKGNIAVALREPKDKGKEEKVKMKGNGNETDSSEIFTAELGYEKLEKMQEEEEERLKTEENVELMIAAAMDSSKELKLPEDVAEKDISYDEPAVEEEIRTESEAVEESLCGKEQEMEEVVEVKLDESIEIIEPVAYLPETTLDTKLAEQESDLKTEDSTAAVETESIIKSTDASDLPHADTALTDSNADDLIETKCLENAVKSPNETSKPIENIFMSHGDNQQTQSEETPTMASFIPEAVKKEPITLPLKKQMSKFKCFEAAHQQHADIVAEVKPKEAETPLPANEQSIVQHVSVETSTLRDILKTVQLNEKTAAASELCAVTAAPTEIINEAPVSEIIADNIKNELEVTIPAHTVELGSVKADSPRTDDASPPGTRKVTRRYERRQRRGDEATHKTLEETFAEIAAQSSKEILELQYKEFTSYEEEEEHRADEISKERNEQIDHQSTETEPSSIHESNNKDEADPVRESAGEEVTAACGDALALKNVFEAHEVVVKEIEVKSNDLTAPNVEMVSSNVAETQTTTSTENVAKSEAQIDSVSLSTTTDSFELSEEHTPIPQKDPRLIITPTPARRGRKPKNKPIEMKTPTLNAEISESVHALIDSAKETEAAKKTEQSTEKIRKPKKGKLSKDETTNAETEDTKAFTLETATSSKELNQGAQHTPKPPKKRLSKIHMEMDMKQQQVEMEMNQDSEPSAESLSANTASSAPKVIKEGATKKAKKSMETKDVGKTEERTDEDARSASSMPITKRSKHKQKADHPTDEHSSGNSGKKKHGKSLEQINKMKSDKSDLKQKSQGDRKERGDKPKEKHPMGAPSSSKKPEKKRFLETEEAASRELHKKLEEKCAKKKRQKKLKEAFEAALNEHPNLKGQASETPQESAVPVQETQPTEPQSPASLPDVACPVTAVEMKATESPVVALEPVTTPLTAVSEPEEDPDPLKDIEKFIEDGVNLLKRDYKIDDDSVDVVIPSSKTLSSPVDNKPTVSEVDTVSESVTEAIADSGVEIRSTASTPISDLHLSDQSTKIELHQSLYETPADTPVATPTATPPPKSPLMDLNADEIPAVRRSHRIKQITKTPKALVGRGLVRDKERFSLKDDVETKTHYTLDDHLMDLAEVEAKNAKFLKEMEERLSNFQVIKENEYKCERIVSREARKMICDCFLTSEEEERGELGCGEDCLNRLLMIECGPDCNVKDRCTNKRFQKLLCSPCRVFRTEKKGFGIMADVEILPGEFIMEYVGEVIDGDEFEQRRNAYSQDKNRHYYFMALRSDAIIDATIKGNISRFINHSCDPNAETQKWTVNGELRIGFFSRKSIMPGEEITFDYQYQRYGREAQRCYCESAACRGWIGEEPNSDEGEQVDDSDVENLADGLLDSDEEDSDDSVTDAEEVKKKLEIAAAEAKLGALGDDLKSKLDDKSDTGRDKKKRSGDDVSKESEEESKSKIKKLLSKMAEKVAKKKTLTEKKKQRKRRGQSASDVPSTSKSRYLEDPDIEDEVNFLSRCGLKNQLDTLRLSRLMVRAKLPQTRLNLLQILRKGELPCRRLFLDYHGLRLLHGWMSEDAGDMNIRMALLETLECLPIVNKTVLTDSKVYQSVRNWCGKGGDTAAGGRSSLSPSDESSKESSSSNSQQASEVQDVPSELQKLASKLTATWDGLPEIFRIPKRERIEQMKEHEREADRQYAATTTETDSNRSQISDRYQRDRFGRGLANRYGKPYGNKDVRNITIVGASTSSDPRRRADNGSYASSMSDSTRHLSKEQRREMFAAKVARDEAEKRLAEERREFETKCRFFGLDPKKTRPQELPLCVNPATGQWYSVERQPIPTPPSYAHVQVHVKPKSTDPADYQLPPSVATLPPQWKFAITPQGNIYYYHVQYRVPQWEPPTAAQLAADGSSAADSDSESDEVANDSSDDDDEVLLGMNQAQLKAYITKKVEARRQKRYNRLVDERAISPRREEDRIYNQLEVRKYKENKEKIRKRKEEIRRRRAEALKAGISLSADDLEATTSSAGDPQAAGKDSDDELNGALPIQDYLLSSDEEDVIKAECNNSPLIDKIVQGDKIVDELDALTTKRPLKRALPPHRELSAHASGSSSSTAEKYEHKKRKLDKKDKSKKSKDSDSKYRRLKEKFRCEIAGIIVQHLKPYRKDNCPKGRIQSDEDFNHLARKLTHFVMIKELKYCESVGQTLVVTESVKNKSREFIKKYMAKYAEVYEKPTNDPEFKDIPFTI